MWKGVIRNNHIFRYYGLCLIMFLTYKMIQLHIIIKVKTYMVYLPFMNGFLYSSTLVYFSKVYVFICLYIYLTLFYAFVYSWLKMIYTLMMHAHKHLRIFVVLDIFGSNDFFLFPEYFWMYPIVIIKKYMNIKSKDNETFVICYTIQL